MIKEYEITYEKKTYNGYGFDTTIHRIQIPAKCLFDAVDYAHNTLELDSIKEVCLV